MTLHTLRSGVATSAYDVMCDGEEIDGPVANPDEDDIKIHTLWYDTDSRNTVHGTSFRHSHAGVMYVGRYVMYDSTLYRLLVGGWTRYVVFRLMLPLRALQP